MAHSRLNDADLLAALTAVFREHGYEGASLSRLSAATGLERASLYHRFPGGKDQMVAAVVAGVDRWFAAHVLAALRGTGDPAARVRRAARHLDDFYGGGTRPCILDTLSLPAGGKEIHDALRAQGLALHEALAEVAREAGATAATARQRALQALIEIEGSLVVARVLGDAKAFLSVLARLPARITDVDG